MRKQRITERHHGSEECTSRRAQRFFRLKHNCKLDQIEPPDMHQRASPLLSRDGLRMQESVPNLPQSHQPEGRRQID
jgi:hypothetical protein